MKVRLHPKERRAVSNAGALGVAIVLVVALFAFAYLFIPSSNAPKLPTFAGLPTGTSTATTATSSGASTANPNTCSSSSIQGILSGYAGGSLTSPQNNRFTLQGGAYVAVVDSPGSVTAATKYGPSTNTYGLGWLDQLKATNADPLWIDTSLFGATPATNPWGATVANSVLSTNPATLTELGTQVFTLSCVVPAGASNNVNVWSEAGLIFPEPASGTTATTNVAVLMTSQAGSDLTKAATVMPTTSTVWDIKLNIYSTNTVGCLTVPIYGTQSTPVINYANGQVLKNSFVTRGCFLIISLNQTGVSLSVPSPFTLTPITVNTVTSGSRAYLIPISGCTPSPGSGVSSSAPYTCVDVPLSIYETATQGTKHIGITADFVSMQDSSYILTNFVNPANTAYGSYTIGGTGGAPPGWTYLTPTSGNNAGTPSPLINTFETIVQTY